jgi:hypothetical protein
MIGTVEYLYNRDVNGVYYINANLPAAQSAFTGVDGRPRWLSNRINNVPGNQITNAIVLKNQSIGRSWNIATSLSKNTNFGLNLKGAYSYGESKNTVDPGSIAAGSWTGNPMSGDPNNPGLGYSSNSPGHRFFLRASFTKEYFRFGATSVAFYWETRTLGNTSYTFAGDMNGDGATGNDLIYIPRDQSEMNFASFTSGGRTFTAAEQASAFEAYIQQDAYLREHRGEHAERGAVFLPLVSRGDLSVTQDLFTSLMGRRHAGQIRIDILNFTNMLNHDWGVGQRVIQNQILTNASVDAQGRPSYRMNTFSGDLVRQTFQRTTTFNDVYSFMISFRYTFN